MRCPACKNGITKTIESRKTKEGVRRRREYPNCLSRFTTQEVLTRKSWLDIQAKRFNY